MSYAKRVEVNLRRGSLPVWMQPGESPTLVFLHYCGSSYRIYDQVIDRLASGGAVVSFDHRGWGESRHLPGPYGISDLADDVLRIVEELDIDRYVLVGHSMGGKTAQLVASQWPNGLVALALIAPSRRGQQQAGNGRGSRTTSLIAAKRSATRLNRSCWRIRCLLSSDSRSLTMASLRAEAQLAWPQDGLLTDITDDVRAIEVPTIVLAGLQGKVDPPESMKSNPLPFIPEAQMTLLGGTGHLSPLEVPRQLAREARPAGSCRSQRCAMNSQCSASSP